MDFYDDLDDFRVGTIVKEGLLRAVAADVMAGRRGKFRIRS
jgi:hypothetical protein